MFLLTPLVAAIVPFIIWPIELLLPYPYIIEEVAKAFLVLMLGPAPKSSRLALTLSSAALFTFSETVLYSLNIALMGDITTMLTRLALTFALHSITMIIMLYFLGKRIQFILLGIPGAVIIHYAYNVIIGLTG